MGSLLDSMRASLEQITLLDWPCVPLNGFSGLFEIAFGLGAVLYYLEVYTVLRVKRTSVIKWAATKFGLYLDQFEILGWNTGRISDVFAVLLGITLLLLTVFFALFASLVAIAPAVIIVLTFGVSAMVSTLTPLFVLLVIGIFNGLQLHLDLVLTLVFLSFLFPMHILIAYFLPESGVSAGHGGGSAVCPPPQPAP